MNRVLSGSSKGSILVFSLIILSIMLVASLSVLAAATYDRKSSLATEDSIRSFQVANSGAEMALLQIYADVANRPVDLDELADELGGTCSDNGGRIDFEMPGGGQVVVFFYEDADSLYDDGCDSETWRGDIVKIKSEGTQFDDACYRG